MEKRPILIVDDDEGIQELLQSTFESFDYPVSVASNGLEAIQVLEEEAKPGLIILDYMMPIMNGEEFAESIHRRNEWADIPIALITGYSKQFENVPQVTEVLRKPFDLAEVEAVVHRYCG